MSWNLFNNKSSPTIPTIKNKATYCIDITYTAPHGIEILEGLFDNAISIIEGNSPHIRKDNNYLYGGAIRDLVANMPIKGDLDILTTESNYINKLFSYNPKWKKEINHTTNLLYASTVAKYINIHGKKIDIIGCTDILAHILKTDLLCCCLLMTLDGRIYEMVEGALEDCLSKRLRTNPFDKKIIKEKLKNRITKLEDRGWKSEINLDEIQQVDDNISNSSPAMMYFKTQNNHWRV